MLVLTVTGLGSGGRPEARHGEAAERQDVVAVTLFDLQHLGKVKVYQFILLEPNEIERRKSSRCGTPRRRVSRWAIEAEL